LLLRENGCPGILSVIGTAFLWYMVGSYLGRSKLSSRAALAVWIGIQVVMSVFGVVTYIAFIAMYN
jgi:hypothetical protein